MESLKLPLFILVILIAISGYFIMQPRGRTPGPAKSPASSKPMVKTDELVKKAEAALEKNSFTEVLQILSPASSDDDPSVQALLGYANAGLNNFEAAVASFEKALAKKRDTRYGYALAFTLETMGLPDRALKTYRDLSRAPLPRQIMVKIHQGIARCALSTNDSRTAIDSYKYIIQEDPTKIEPFVGMLKLMKASGTSKGVDEIRERGDLLHSKNFHYCYWLGSVYFDAGKDNNALDLFRTCLAIDPTNSSPYYYIYKILKRARNIPEAVKILEKFHALNPNLPYIFFQGAIEAQTIKRPDIAFKFFRTAVTMDRTLLGRDDQGMISAIEKYVKSNGSSEEKAFLIPFTCFINSDFAKAAKLMKKLLPSLKKPLLIADAKRLLNEASAVLNREAAYDAYLAKVRAEQSTAISSLHKQLEARRNTVSDTPESESDKIKRAALNNPRDAKLQYSTALQLARAGDIEGAKLFLHETLRANPNVSEAHYSLARILHFEGNSGDAMMQLQQAIKINQSDSQSRSLLASIHLEGNDPEQAEREARASLLINPYNGEARLVLARALMKSDHPETALEEIEAGITLETDPSKRAMFQELRNMLKKSR